jgi:tripartite-type tricarboxylate transporter receptor subunit TctC
MTMNTLRRTTLRAALAATALCATLAWSADAAAQTAWPSKPVRVIVPFAPGGSTDVIGRLLAQKLAEMWGQSVVVENRTGAGGNIGADLVAKSPGDGYTLLFASGSIAINPQLYKNMPFDTQKDLVPITNVASGPMLVVVPDDSPAKSVKDLIAMAKARPGTVNFGSAGVGSQVHLAAENFADAAGIDIVHVPYKGEAPAYTDLIGHQTQMMVGNFAAASALLGAGRLRALAVTGKTRSPLLPDVPTASESGLPGFENSGWFGLFAPAGTPPDVLAKIQRDSLKVLAATDFKARLYVQGMAPVGNTPAQFAKAMDEESKHWAAVVKNRKLSAN